jgi:ATP-dependent protease HslVU (ClpYQ) peptidase subunit
MTCIVGYVDKKSKKVIIGGDSASSADADIIIRKDAKVFKNGDFVIGCTTSFRMIQLLRFSFKPPEIKSKDVYEYMCTDFINAVRNCFRDGGYLQKYTDGDEKGGTFLVAYKNRLFKIENDFQVGESAYVFDSIGCGTFYALGALYVIQKNETPVKEKVLCALKASAFFSGAVQGPFVLVST